MSRPTAIAVGAVTLMALLLLAAGRRVLDRDSQALREEYAAERMRAITEAAAVLARDVEEIGEDLELAAALMSRSASPAVRDRELHAIATIKRAYLAAELRDAAGTTLVRVTAADARADVLGPAGTALDETIAQASLHPGLLQTSRPLGPDDDDLAWYRVFARSSPHNDGLVVAFVVDMRPVLARLSLLRSPSTALLVLGARGLPAPASTPALAARVRDLDLRTSPGVARLMAAVRARSPASAIVGAAEAHGLGLPDAPAVAVTTPVLIEDGEPWSLALVASTSALAAQERTLLRRLLVGGGVAVALLAALSAYFVRNARRAAALHERLRLEDRLVHSEKLATAGQLSAGIAHEIGTPLNVIRARAELALDRLGDHAAAPGLRIVVEQVDHVSRLITQLLDYARVSPPTLQPVTAAAALANVAELLGVEAQQRGIALDVEAATDLAPLRADPGQLQQVLVNLTVNALDASDRGARVVLRALRGRGHTVGLQIEDHGAGIERSVRSRVFDPFYTTKKRGQGTGLGLWVVAQLVRAHGGEIELDSKPGAGTLVRITWPSIAPCPGSPDAS